MALSSANPPIPACFEDATFTLPSTCPARALPAETLTYEGINFGAGAHGCEASEFAGSAIPNFGGGGTTALDGNHDGLVDFYDPAVSLKDGPQALVDGLPTTATYFLTDTFVGNSISLDPRTFLATDTFNVIGDWGFDGASVLYGIDPSGLAVEDKFGDILFTGGYALFTSVGTTTLGESPLSTGAKTAPPLSAAKQLGSAPCKSNSDCELVGKTLPGANGPVCLKLGKPAVCGCQVDSDCGGLVCVGATPMTSGTCALPAGAVFGDVNGDGLMDELGQADTPRRWRRSNLDARCAAGTRCPLRASVSSRISNGPSVQDTLKGDALIDMDGDGLPDRWLPAFRNSFAARHRQEVAALRLLCWSPVPVRATVAARYGGPTAM